MSLGQTNTQKVSPCKEKLQLVLRFLISKEEQGPEALLNGSYGAGTSIIASAQLRLGAYLSLLLTNG